MTAGDGAVHPGWQAARRGHRGDAAGAADEAAEDARGATADAPAASTDWGDDRAVAAAVGRRLRRAREAAGISQTALAARFGCARTTICRWEQGQRAPSLAALVRLAAVLGVAPAALLPGTGEEG